MCYSPETSFAAGSVLALVGVATIKKSLRYDRSMLVFSMFPAIFSVHQFIEGFVWLSIDGAIDGKIFRYLYIFIAVLLWPILTPLAAVVSESDRTRRRARTVLFALGLILGGYLVVKLAKATGIEAKVVGHSISYIIHYDSRPPIFIDYAYATITIIPLVTLQNRIIRVIGILVGISFLYSYLEMREVWFSVWCLAAAAFSVLFLFSIRSADRHGT